MDLSLFKNALEYAKNKLNEKKGELNRINVFPVADGDTGTNMSHTITYALDSIDYNLEDSDFFRELSENVLIGARGNSGSLFSQVIKELCRPIVEKKDLSSEMFLEALEDANKKMREILQQPKEGTMITVIRMANEAVSSQKLKNITTIEFFERYAKEARKALKKTPDFLEILKRKNVVDSGAKGFVYFVESIAAGLKGEIFQVDKSREDETVLEDVHDLDQITFRYCTEFVIKGNGFDKNEFKNYLSKKGDSLIYIVSDDLLKVHIHTDIPDDLFRYIESLGQVIFTKKDDMLEQVAKTEKTQLVVIGANDVDKPLFREVGFFNFMNYDQVISLSDSDKENTVFVPVNCSDLEKLSKVGNLNYVESNSIHKALFSMNFRLMNQTPEVLSVEMNKGITHSIEGKTLNSKQEFENWIKNMNETKDIEYFTVYSNEYKSGIEKLLENKIDPSIEFSYYYVKNLPNPFYVLIEKE